MVAGGMASIRAFNAAGSRIAVGLCLSVVCFLGRESAIFCAAENAQHQEAHLKRILAGFAATTVTRCLNSFLNFTQACQDLETLLQIFLKMC